MNGFNLRGTILSENHLILIPVLRTGELVAGVT